MKILNYDKLDKKYKYKGIYRIFTNHPLLTDFENNRCYIGSSKNILKRFRQHQYDLKHNRHTNYNLQKVYSYYNQLIPIEEEWLFAEILYICNENTPENDLLIFEEHYIYQHPKLYNIILNPLDYKLKYNPYDFIE